MSDVESATATFVNKLVAALNEAGDDHVPLAILIGVLECYKTKMVNALLSQVASKQEASNV